MEEHFTPGLRTKPALLIGSQSYPSIRGNFEEQAWEGFYLAAARPGDVVIVRNIDPEYIQYWTELMGDQTIINIQDKNPGEFLTQVILNDKELQGKIKKLMHPDSKLMAFLPTELEADLAKALHIPLHGNHVLGARYGIKSGIRELAEKAGIPMPPGYTCRTLDEVESAISSLSEKFDTFVLKHDQSFSGYYSKKINKDEQYTISDLADEVSGGKFTENKDIIVVEGWLKSKASLCMHIEIIEDEPTLCAGWQQIIDKDALSYMGAGPLQLTDHAFSSFIQNSLLLGKTLQKAGGFGSFGPDFIITADDETRMDPDTAVLIELNARLPYTAIPLEIVRDIRGKVGEGFLAKHVHVPKKTTVNQILSVLSENGLLIRKKDPQATGIVPYNTGLLPWGIFDIVAMADTWERTSELVKQVDMILSDSLDKPVENALP